jgi:hypothetical protein
VLRNAAILVVCAFCWGTAVPQVPSVRRAPIPEYREAIFLGTTMCRPDPTFEYCSKASDKFYTILLNGQPYVLRSGPSNAEILAMIGAAVTPQFHALETPNMNVLAGLRPETDVQVRFHGGGVDVRALTDSSKGPRYLASHYTLAPTRLDRLYHRGPDVNAN